MGMHFRSLALVLLTLLASSRDLRAQGARLFKSGPIQSTADGAWVWVANPDADSVSRIEVATDTVTEFPLPDAGTKHLPLGLSVREDGSEIWVACHDSDRVYVLAPDGSQIARIDLPWGSGPHSLALSRDQAQVLVTLHRAEALAVLDAATHVLSARLAPVFPSPLGICWTETGGDAWITHLFADGEDPRLSRVSFAGPAPKVVSNLLAKSTTPKQSGALAAPYQIAEGGYLTFRGHLAQIPSAARANRLLIPTQYNNINENIFTPDSTIQSTLRTVDLSTRFIPNTNNDKVILTAVQVHDPAGSNPYVGPGWDAHVSGPVDVGFSVDGSQMWVLFEQSNDLVAMPTSTPAVKPSLASPLPEIGVGARPLGLTVLSNQAHAYVWNSLDATVSIVDLGSQTELRRLGVSSTPPLGGGRNLNGAKLFHTSTDPRISINEKVACASCHPHGEHDGRTWDFENLPGNHGPRSSMSMLGLSLTLGPPDPTTGWGQLHRSGDRDEIQDFDHTFTGASMMGTGFLGGGQQPELGPNPNAGRDADLDDMASYLLSLPPLRKSPYRAANGTLTESAQRGATFFRGASTSKPADAACATCHDPARGFVDFQFHDVGQRRPAAEREINSRTPAWHVNTPTLIGSWTTAPYDGVATYASSYLTLVQDLARRTTHGTPGQLTRRQLRDLAEFLGSIDGDMTAAEVAAATDAVAPRVQRVSITSTTRIEIWFDEGVDAGAASSTAWRVAKVGGTDVPITSASYDAQNGDRITLFVDRLEKGCSPSHYDVIPLGPIRDLADRASGGVANLLDIADPSNTQRITLGDTLTITLGSSGYENLTVPVHDAALIGSGLPDGSHGSPWLSIDTAGVQRTGLVRFGWQAAFAAATGLTSGADIVDASLTLSPEFGDVANIEARRCLLAWNDIGHNDWAYDRSRGSIGAPTWNEHIEGTTNGANPWNQAGAMKSTAGVDGRAVSDYDAANDIAATPDVVATMPAINEPFVMGGSLMADAYGFWFDNPSVDHGHAIRIVKPSPFVSRYFEVKFQKGELDLQLYAPVLTLTYNVPSTLVAPPWEVSGPLSGLPLLVTKDPAGLRLSFEDQAAAGYHVYEGALSITARPWYSHAGAACDVSTVNPRGGRLEATLAPASGIRYLLVTAHDGCLEGTSGSDSFGVTHPAGNLDCLP